MSREVLGSVAEAPSARDGGPRSAPVSTFDPGVGLVHQYPGPHLPATGPRSGGGARVGGSATALALPPTAGTHRVEPQRADPHKVDGPAQDEPDVAEARGDPDDPGGPHAGRRAPGRRSRRRRVAAVVVVLLASSLVGWVSASTWRAAVTGPQRLDFAVMAGIVAVAPTADLTEPVRSSLTVQVVNRGESTVLVTGTQPSLDAVSSALGRPAGVSVAAGTQAEITVDLLVRCASPNPLRVPDLRVVGRDGVVRQVPVLGGATAAATLCGRAPPERQVLVVTRARVEDPYFAILLRSPTGRSVHVYDITAGGFRLDAHPLPAAVDGLGMVVWLHAPTVCAPQWQVDGLPETLVAHTEVEAEATITVPVGLGLAQWLSAKACGGGSP